MFGILTLNWIYYYLSNISCHNHANYYKSFLFLKQYTAFSKFLYFLESCNFSHWKVEHNIFLIKNSTEYFKQNYTIDFFKILHTENFLDYWFFSKYYVFWWINFKDHVSLYEWNLTKYYSFNKIHMLDNRTMTEGKKNSCLVNIQVDWQQEINICN